MSVAETVLKRRKQHCFLVEISDTDTIKITKGIKESA